MSDPGHGYAPQSPDLSGYHSAQPALQPIGHFPQPALYPNSYLPPASNNPLSPYNNRQSSISPGNFASRPPTQPQHRSQPNMDEDEWAPASETSTKASGRKSKKQKVEEHFDKSAPGVEEGIEVKTKFPVARIKRIMQHDEDVGKVAQVTPTAVSKALELFMISLVTKAANQARTKSAKKVTAAHLKQVVENDEQFDFLADIISKVPDAPAPKKEDDSEGAGDGKKKRGASRRKRKEEGDD